MFLSWYLDSEVCVRIIMLGEMSLQIDYMNFVKYWDLRVSIICHRVTKNFFSNLTFDLKKISLVHVIGMANRCYNIFNISLCIDTYIGRNYCLPLRIQGTSCGWYIQIKPLLHGEGIPERYCATPWTASTEIEHLALKTNLSYNGLVKVICAMRWCVH